MMYINLRYDASKQYKHESLSLDKLKSLVLSVKQLSEATFRIPYMNALYCTVELSTDYFSDH